MLEEDTDFADKFKKVFNSSDIQEADDFTPEVLEETYVCMKILLPRDGEGTELFKVTKYLRDENVIPIGRHNENPMFYTRVYEVEYLNVHKASIAANTIDTNLFSQVGEEGNGFVIFDEIVDHRVHGTETMQ